MRIWDKLYPFVGIGERPTPNALPPYAPNLSSAGEVIFYGSFGVTGERNKNL